MLRSRRSFLSVVFVSASLATPRGANAGSLEPPGPPAPTMKTLTDIEPRAAIAQPPPGPGGFPIVINQPGSYYLRSVINGVTGQNGITITVPNVTLDLNGFAVVGAGNSSGIEVAPGLQGVSVRNGTVSGWANGVNGAAAVGLRVLDLVATNNSVSGILGGADSVVSGCIARQNTDRGIQITSGVIDRSAASGNNIGITLTDGTVRNSTAIGNGTGIVAVRSVVENSTANSNTADGILVSAGRVQNSIARGNSGDGIEALGDSIVLGNVSTLNGAGAGAGAGIHATGDKNHIEGNNVTSNDVGIDTNDTGVENNVVVRNTASCNTSNYDSGANNQIGTVGSLTTIGSNPWGNVSTTAFCS